jgi:hypothetical protein
MKKILLGILVITLVFGMTVVGCDGGGDDGINILDALSITGSPETTKLSRLGLDQSKFTQLKESTSGFRGWTLDEDDDLIMAWINRSESDFNIVAAKFKEVFDVASDERGTEPQFPSVKYVFAVKDDVYYNIQFFTQKVTYQVAYVPAETIFVYIVFDDD